MDYQICSFCVMDSTDKFIVFDDNGRCNHCKNFENEEKRLKSETNKISFEKLANEIKTKNKNLKYDGVCGISGGVDSSYVALKLKEFGLRPLLVHLDNGWNSELSLRNIENLVKKLGFDLHTVILNWNEFKNLQKAYLNASVIDIEVLTDHAINATLHNFALKTKTKIIFSGTNNATEGILPPSWVYRKNDLINIKDIAKKNKVKIRSYPTLSLIKQLFYQKVLVVKYISVLDYFHFQKEKSLKELQNKIDYIPYEAKHFESDFTRFYQGYILPKKFGIDKRKAHFSTLICNNEISRKEALKELEKSPYSNPLKELNDLNFVLKKLNFSPHEFKKIMEMKEVPHEEYKTDKAIRNIIFKKLYKVYATFK